MYIFGHLGITTGAALAYDRKADVRLAMLLAILPDLLDKPAALLPVTLGNTRSFAHGVLGAGAVLGALLVLKRRRPAEAIALWACYAGHLALDRMWLGRDARILLWPFLGGFPPRDREGPGTPYLLAWNVAGEVIGFAILYALARRRRVFDRA